MPGFKNNSGSNPLNSLMKKASQGSADSGGNAKMNYKEALEKKNEEKKEEEQEELNEAKKTSNAKRSGSSNSPELIRAKFIAAIIRYSIIGLMAALLGLGLYNAVPKLLKSAGSSIKDSLVR